jgi:ATP-dependent Lon protease
VDRLRLVLPDTSEVIDVSSTLPLLPMRDVVIYPHATLPLFVGRKPSVAALEAAINDNKILVALTQKRPETARPEADDLFTVGTVVRVLQLFRLPDGTTRILVEGLSRVRLRRFIKGETFSSVNISAFEDHDDVGAVDLQIQALAVREAFDKYCELNRRIAPEVGLAMRNICEPTEISFKAAAFIQTEVAFKQSLLEAASCNDRLDQLITWLEKESVYLLDQRRKVSSLLDGDRDQAADILFGEPQGTNEGSGYGAEVNDELEELVQQIESARLPEAVGEKAMKELDRLSKMSPISPEATVCRSYIEWLIQIPWHSRTKDRTQLEEVERILDEDHYGLRKVKERILELISVIKLSREVKGPILCLTGPPGVGKTSLGRSIARSLGRKFVRMSLGGVRDEAEIRGHRRTYIGSMPGRIVQAMKRAGTVNPVILLDEVDKLGNDHRGDPASALLEVLDPEQNSAFNDHYLEVDYDLSQVLFITTSNLLHAIPEPLRDRMEVIQIPGYMENEKIQIASRFLLPRQRKANGLAIKDLSIPNDVYQALVREYTREAGVRNLEREIARICRRVAKIKAGGRDETLSALLESMEVDGQANKTKSKTKTKTKTASTGTRRKALNLTLACEHLQGLLGSPRHTDMLPLKSAQVGAATGLAWTSVGGELLTIEVGVLPGRGTLILTGKLGETMRESAQAALSYIRARCDRFGLERSFYRKVDIHVHVPEGAVPKDGPSAGVTLALAMVSALTGIATRPLVALTGEITLLGNVLPIGGLGEKIIAARRCGIETILLPQANYRDIAELPEDLLAGIKLQPVETIDQVLEYGLETKPHPLRQNDTMGPSQLAA